MPETRKPLVLWGCDPRRQFESAWLQTLLGSVQHVQVGAPQGAVRPGAVLVETGLSRLERHPDPLQVEQTLALRRQRVQWLSAAGRFGVIHLSDEEGFDGDELYPLLPQGTVVWRNFPYPRHQGVRVFPIGPRAEFLEPALNAPARRPASSRPFPWAFMGTLWASGSRTRAASLFLRALPQGFFHGGRGFAQGLPLADYRHHLLQSAFALCPEGDRHLDTFRLYESLQAGCIPVLVDQRSMAQPLLGPSAALPVFERWEQALAWVQQLLQQPALLDNTQAAISAWWQWRRQSLTGAMRHTFGLPLC